MTSPTGHHQMKPKTIRTIAIAHPRKCECNEHLHQAPFPCQALSKRYPPSPLAGEELGARGRRVSASPRRDPLHDLLAQIGLGFGLTRGGWPPPARRAAGI